MTPIAHQIMEDPLHCGTDRIYAFNSKKFSPEFFMFVTQLTSNALCVCCHCEEEGEMLPLRIVWAKVVWISLMPADDVSTFFTLE